MSEPKYRIQLSQAKLSGRLGLEAIVSVFQGDTLVGENQVNLSNAEKRNTCALVLSERFGIDQAEEKLLQLMQTVRQSLESDSGDDPGMSGSQGTQLVQLAKEAGAELWHSAEMEPFATIAVQDHQENWFLTSRGFRRWLSRKYYETNQKAPGSQAIQDALGVLSGMALFDGPERPVFTRLADYQGNVYLDLCNQDWEVVEITATSWRIVTDPPVKFRRVRGMLPLPNPVPGGDIRDLRQFINVDDRDWPLVLAWLVAALRPTGPYPVLVIHGDQGSAKSTAVRILRSLVDPNRAALRAEPKDPRDLMIAATNGWVVALDNLSRLSTWLSDALCRLATGGGFSTRELYTDDEEKLFDAQRPVILNGIEELATRGDLLDRAIIIYLPRISRQQRVEESVLKQRFDQAQPAILGAVLDAVSYALANVGRVHLAELPRMADFAKWATASETGLGLEPGTFITAYTRNQESANDLTLEASPIVGPIQELVDLGEWRGTASQLLSDLDTHIKEQTRKLKSWPKDGRALSNALRRLAPNLRESGVSVEFNKKERFGKKVLRTITLRRVGDLAATSPDLAATPPDLAATPEALASYDVAAVADVAAKIPPHSNQVIDNDEEVF